MKGTQHSPLEKSCAHPLVMEIRPNSTRIGVVYIHSRMRYKYFRCEHANPRLIERMFTMRWGLSSQFQRCSLSAWFKFKSTFYCALAAHFGNSSLLAELSFQMKALICYAAFNIHGSLVVAWKTPKMKTLKDLTYQPRRGYAGYLPPTQNQRTCATWEWFKLKWELFTIYLHYRSPEITNFHHQTARPPVRVASWVFITEKSLQFFFMLCWYIYMCWYIYYNLFNMMRKDQETDLRRMFSASIAGWSPRGCWGLVKKDDLQWKWHRNGRLRRSTPYSQFSLLNWGKAYRDCVM